MIGEGRRCLPAAGLADEPVRLALADGEDTPRSTPGRRRGRCTRPSQVPGARGGGVGPHRSKICAIASAIRLMPTTSVAMASDGKSAGHQMPASMLGVVRGDVLAPVGRWRLGGEAEKRERGYREDGVAEPDGELDDDRPDDVRAGSRRTSRTGPLAAEPRRLHVIELRFAEDSRTNRLRDHRREHERRLRRRASSVTAPRLRSRAAR